MGKGHSKSTSEIRNTGDNRGNLHGDQRSHPFRSIYGRRETPVEVREGQVKTADSNRNLTHPEVSSCLTFTHVDTNGNKVGGHGVLMKDSNRQQLGVDSLIEEVNTQIGGKEGKLLISGNESSWNYYLPTHSNNFNNVNAIVEYFRGRNPSTEIHRFDVSDYINTRGGEAAPVTIKVGSTKYSVNTSSGEKMHQNNW